MSTLTAELFLKAYAAGIFPMAESAETNELHWCAPTRRAILPLKSVICPRSTARALRRANFSFTIDKDFPAVLRGCAGGHPARPSTWINQPIRAATLALHHKGYAHSIEVWHEQHLVGGLYGVALGRAFFAESMFSTVSEASKAALVRLASVLEKQGYELFDVQFQTAHLAQFGVYEVSRAAYQKRLEAALTGPPAAFPTALER